MGARRAVKEQGCTGRVGRGRVKEPGVVPKA